MKCYLLYELLQDASFKIDTHSTFPLSLSQIALNALQWQNIFFRTLGVDVVSGELSKHNKVRLHWWLRRLVGCRLGADIVVLEASFRLSCVCWCPLLRLCVMPTAWTSPECLMRLSHYPWPTGCCPLNAQELQLPRGHWYAQETAIGSAITTIPWMQWHNRLQWKIEKEIESVYIFINIYIYIRKKDAEDHHVICCLTVHLSKHNQSSFSRQFSRSSRHSDGWKKVFRKLYCQQSSSTNIQLSICTALWSMERAREELSLPI